MSGGLIAVFAAVFTAIAGAFVAIYASRDRSGTRITHITTTHDQSESSGE